MDSRVLAPKKNRETTSIASGRPSWAWILALWGLPSGFWAGMTKTDQATSLLNRDGRNEWEDWNEDVYLVYYSIFIYVIIKNPQANGQPLNVGERLPSNMGRTKIHWRSLWHQQPKAVRFVDLLQKELEIGWHRAIGRTGWHLEVKLHGWFSHVVVMGG